LARSCHFPAIFPLDFVTVVYSEYLVPALLRSIATMALASEGRLGRLVPSAPGGLPPVRACVAFLANEIRCTATHELFCATAERYFRVKQLKKSRYHADSRDTSLHIFELRVRTDGHVSLDSEAPAPLMDLPDEVSFQLCVPFPVVAASGGGSPGPSAAGAAQGEAALFADAVLRDADCLGGAGSAALVSQGPELQSGPVLPPSAAVSEALPATCGPENAVRYEVRHPAIVSGEPESHVRRDRHDSIVCQARSSASIVISSGDSASASGRLSARNPMLLRAAGLDRTLLPGSASA
jgi:hypothetical protein